MYFEFTIAQDIALQRSTVTVNFRPLMEVLIDVYEVSANYANPQEHVPEAERNNRVIKERFRAAFHRLPFLKIPKIMIKILTMECAKKLNFFPPKGGISPYYSPRMIMHQQNLNYDKHCSIPFGSYVQAHHEPEKSNTQHPRTLDCIYLRYTDSDHGGHHLLDLHTGRTIKRRSVTPIPITKNIIDMVHAMATKDKVPDGLKIATKAGLILYDSSWIAGVDYESDEDDDEEDYEPESENEDDEDEDEYDDESDDNDKSEAEDNDEINLNEMDPNEAAEILDEEIFPDAADMNEAVIQDDETVHNTVNSDNENEIIEQNNDSNDELSEEEIENNNDEQEDEVEVVQDDINPSGATIRTASGREVRPPNRLNMHQCHLITQGHEETIYTIDNAKVIAQNIVAFNNCMVNKQSAFAQTYSLQRGLKHFGKKGYDAAYSEMKQLHDRTVFVPVNVQSLTPQEKRRAMESLIFLVEKRDGRVKARTCANGSTQRDYISKEEAASPTVMSESILITATIDAKEERA